MPNPRLSGKVVLITGASGAQGRATARLFADEGADLVLADIDAEGLDDVAAEVEARGGQALTTPLDVTDETAWSPTVDACRTRFGGLDVLVNNAGVSTRAGVLTAEVADWDVVLGVNLDGTWLGMKHAVPLMRERGGGSVINISSIAALIGFGAGAAYQAAKGGVTSLTRSAAIEFAPVGVRVNAIHPGILDVRVATVIGPTPADPDHDPAGGPRIPLGRRGTPEEIAYGSLYLASDESSYVTGTSLVIDGGYTAW